MSLGTLQANLGRRSEIHTDIERELGRGDTISIIALVDSLIAHANALRASDIHLEPTQHDVRVRVRIDGVLEDLHIFPKSIHQEVVSRIKVLSGLRTDEHFTAQDGRVRHQLKEGEQLDIRISVVPTYHGENAVLRLLGDNKEDFTLSNCGFNKKDEAKIKEALAHSSGMILSTGPTGAGKTTTLYAFLKLLNQPDVSIVTIEDPIEYAVSGVTQIQVNARTSLTFANGLRSILRQDPNIIMVGEIRDQETAHLAVNTALTGHLLLSTLHTNDAATTLPRLLEMGVEPYLVASTVSIAMSQRLVRRICTSCKKEVSASEVPLKKTIKKKETFFRGQGCKACNHTGYLGRLAILEVIAANNDIRNAILRKAPASEITQIARANGMTTMLEDGLEKAKNGETTLEEVMRVVRD